MRKHISVAILIYLAVFLLPNASGAQLYSNESRWRYRLIPYLWLSGIEGDAIVRGVPASFDVSFSDLAKELEFGFQVYFEGQKGKWGYFIAPTYIHLSADGTVNGTSGDVDFTQWLVEFGIIRQLWSQCRSADVTISSLDLLVGGRYWKLSSDLNVSGVGTESGSQDWIDPTIGARYITGLSRQWDFDAQFDVGGFGVGSDFTWSLLLLLGYRTSPSGQLLFGYRILDVDRESGSGADFFKYDVTYSGPILGYSFNF